MKFLIIQTAFIGDVVLATPLVEKLRRFYPGAQIDFLIRRGNEKLLSGHPHLTRIWIWEKKQSKYRSLWQLARQLRRERYDCVVNCQRFANSGLLTVLARARYTVGFRKNPFSLLFSRRVPHLFGTPERPVHEIERNLRLIEHLTDNSPELPRLYPSEADTGTVRALVAGSARYVCLAPASVWFTKQFPAHKWLELINRIPAKIPVFLLGGPEDATLCQQIGVAARHPDVRNMAGQLSFLESAALMRGAALNYVNDSAPMHLASAVNAPVAAVFCSTLPLFGFTPLSNIRFVLETPTHLACRPCGLHGRNACPQGHFNCAYTIDAAGFPIPE
jgi:heptosyltransferase-2